LSISGGSSKSRRVRCYSNGRLKILDDGPGEPCFSHAGGGSIMLRIGGGWSIDVQPLQDANNTKSASQRLIAFPL
jgi:hypothetical protein